MCSNLGSTATMSDVQHYLLEWGESLDHKLITIHSLDNHYGWLSVWCQLTYHLWCLDKKEIASLSYPWTSIIQGRTMSVRPSV